MLDIKVDRGTLEQHFMEMTLLCHSAYFLSSYGRYFHFCHARYEKHAYPIYGCDGGQWGRYVSY